MRASSSLDRGWAKRPHMAGILPRVAGGPDAGRMDACHDAKRIGVLTGGGDVPGLNSVIKSVVYRATELGYEVIGIRRGWEGLTHLTFEPDGSPSPDYVRPLDRRGTRAIDRTGGTMLHTSRTNPARMPRDRPAGQHRRRGRAPLCDRWRPLRHHARSCSTTSSGSGIDALVAIGGDDTLGYRRIGSATEGVPLVAIPKTMDNDVRGTEYCIGFSTAGHARQGADQPPAHDAGQPRADRRVPHLRPQRAATPPGTRRT